MNTKIYTVRSDITTVIFECKKIIENGGLVAFPTETVYGLGADPFNLHAVKRVFKVKGRPQDNPLIFHVSDLKMMQKIAIVPQNIKKFVNTFCPAPLTFVLKSKIDRKYTFNLDTVAVRIPDNYIALKLIETFGNPIVAPSANISGKPSPTKFEHVYEDFNGKIDAIIDGGQTVFGVESTVIDFTSAKYKILRYGAFDTKNIKNLGFEISRTEKSELLKKSPGTHYRHYAPKANIKLFKNLAELKGDLNFDAKTGYIGIKDTDIAFDKKIIFKNKQDYARQLFSSLRYMDVLNISVIYAQIPSQSGIGYAIIDRLKRASEK